MAEKRRKEGLVLSKMKPGDEISATLLLVSSLERRTKSGDPFLECSFRDSSGSIAAKLWDKSGTEKDRVEKAVGMLVPGKAYQITGKVDDYKGAMQLSIYSYSQLPEGSFRPDSFSPISSRNPEEMIAEFDRIAGVIRDQDYSALICSFRNNKRLFDLFCKAPAAKFIHHAWLGGLLEHSLSLCRSVMALAGNYPSLDRDLLITGAIFHDLGKTSEISSDPGFEYSPEGRLIGHIYAGAKIVEDLMDKAPHFPVEKRMLLIHLILSHQGDRSEGFGSPVDPGTPEAIFLHYLDNLDAKLQNCFTALEKDVSAGVFSDARANPLKRSYYRSDFSNKVIDVPGPPEKPAKKGDFDSASPQQVLFENAGREGQG